MDMTSHIEANVREKIETLTREAPPKLKKAIRHALFPLGGMVRPKLSLAVAQANGNEDWDLAMSGAVAVEFLHNASLVHDDLPCFDDALLRRGKPSVHTAYGEDVAVLTGDGLIAAAFETIAENGSKNPMKTSRMLLELARALGSSRGLVAGQAWEIETRADVSLVHSYKTSALFEAAAVFGAISADVDEEPWRRLAYIIGQAYQSADDLMDTMGSTMLSGKSSGRDSVLGRPNAVFAFGLQGAVDRHEKLMHQALEAVPECKGQQELLELVTKIMLRLCPPGLQSRMEKGFKQKELPISGFAQAATV